MPAAAPPVTPIDRQRLAELGARIRRARKNQRVSAVAAAQAAGISRMTLHRIERGEPTVALSAWLAAATALGLAFELHGERVANGKPNLPRRIRLRDFPQLKKLAWQLHGVTDVSPREALDLYERNWRHVDRVSLNEREAALIEDLAREFGGGRLLV